MNNNKTNPLLVWGLIALTALIAAFPMFFVKTDGEEEAFGVCVCAPTGVLDDGAEAVVEEQDPDYEPWFDSIVGELPGEVESGLFALQAALGAGLVGYALGNYKGRSRAERELAAPTDTTSA